MHVYQAERTIWHQYFAVLYALIVIIDTLRCEHLLFLIRLQLWWEHFGNAQEVHMHINSLHHNALHFNSCSVKVSAQQILFAYHVMQQLVQAHAQTCLLTRLSD